MVNKYTTRMFQNDVKKFNQNFPELHTFHLTRLNESVLKLELGDLLGMNAKGAYDKIKESLDQGYSDGLVWAHSAMVFWHKDTSETSDSNLFSILITPYRNAGPRGNVALYPDFRTGMFLGHTNSTREKFDLVTALFHYVNMIALPKSVYGWDLETEGKEIVVTREGIKIHIGVITYVYGR